MCIIKTKELDISILKIKIGNRSEGSRRLEMKLLMLLSLIMVIKYF